MTIQRRQYVCGACGQPIDPLTDSYNLVAGKPRHTTCPTSAALSTLETVPAPIHTEAGQASILASQAPAAGPRFYTLPEAAELLRAGQSTIRRYIRDGKLPAKRLAGGSSKVLIEQGDLLALLEDARESSTREAA